jgi:hypothetical protein
VSVVNRLDPPRITEVEFDKHLANKLHEIARGIETGRLSVSYYSFTDGDSEQELHLSVEPISGQN